ncbi:hypothetical protein ACFQY0_07620 [Haloferula chungangensis]|uniref:Major facilitator superfamily (MFS) profile domain-containing protein n=1 Tax=Haloferula chungangensis TaxID=1048331 RepID=A0ABW2L669_9BACT
MPKTRIFTFAAVGMVLMAVMLASFNYLLAALIVLASVVIGGIVLAVTAWRSEI